MELTSASIHHRHQQSVGWDRHWRRHGVCAGSNVDLFFAVPRSLDHEHALSMCEDCPVRTECLAYALDGRCTHGIFGGTTPGWRRALLARRPHITSWRNLLAQARAEHMRRSHHSAATNHQRQGCSKVVVIK
ncbi:hypothetical protein AOB60_36875 [Streptomyces noursei]|uniref:Transcriptional regulator WhiB n=2 Tax=Streptomyces noursei TaxID=1971 RepID=A0A2N8P7G8_STRNR|nr:WhiB family transcriptional regulator [Streptomyces noursei]PNE36940.1 hypothetical protein AOB60_36875 [Streptomyces noursei]